MKAMQPKDLPGLFLEGLNSSAVDSVVSLYEVDGKIASDPNDPVSGRESIRSMITDFLGQKPRFVLHNSEVVQSGDIALIRSNWTLTLHDSAGKKQEMNLMPTLVARRQPDGRWLVVIDRPVSNS